MTAQQGATMLNPQERHEQVIAKINHLERLGYTSEDLLMQGLFAQNDEAVAAYYGYKTVAELELAVETCWR